LTVIGDGSVKDDGFAAIWMTVTVAANDSGVAEIRLNLTRCHVVMQELSTY